MSHQPLAGHVAVVAGATRGAGRGIARMLGAAGATVYCSGRSVRGHPATAGRTETIEETAELVTAEGGRGIAARTDHTVEAEVERLCEQLLQRIYRRTLIRPAVSAPSSAGSTCWSTTSGAAMR